MIKQAIEKVVSRIDLTVDEMRDTFNEIMTGIATPAQIGAFVTALRMKGETVEEITAAARVMREKSLHISAEGARGDIAGDRLSRRRDVIDTCGTGGGGANTFNVSTTVAFVTAGCGLKVAKHGNRAASSECGSADVLEALGVKIDVSPELMQRCLLEVGIGFLYAPIFHSAMKHASSSRKEIGIRTIFNLLGPLSNPANATAQVVGVYDASLTEKIARVLNNLGTKRAFVVFGTDICDEITITGKTRVSELKNGKIKNYIITPEKFGLHRASLCEIEGGDPKVNAEITLEILKGEKSPRRDIVLLNASASLVAGSKAKDLKSGIKMAARSIDSGQALDKLMKLIEITNR